MARAQPAEEQENGDNEDIQYVIGCIGTTEDLYTILTAKLHEHDTSWRRVAKQLSVTRQALLGAVRRDRVSFSQIRRICEVLDVDPFEFFKVVKPEFNREIL